MTHFNLFNCYNYINDYHLKISTEAILKELENKENWDAFVTKASVSCKDFVVSASELCPKTSRDIPAHLQDTKFAFLSKIFCTE